MKIKLLLAALVLPLVSTTGMALSVARPMTEPLIHVKTELSAPVVLENSQDKNYLKISLTGFNQSASQRSPINLALVIDRSTSMSGDRIEKAREAAIMAVNMLNSEDTLSVVAYDNQAEVIIPATKVNNKTALIKTINQQIKPRGMTALFAGVSKSIDQVDKHLNKAHVNRIILLSDGQANVGPTSVGDLSDLARVAAKKGIAITTIGLGLGYNEDLMTAIAGYSDGNHAFVANSADLEKAFSREFNDVMSVVAQDVVITITTHDQVKPVRLLGRDGQISGNTIKVKMNQIYSDQEKYVLLEVIPAKGLNNESKTLADVVVSYENLSTNKPASYNGQVAINYSKSAAAVKEAVVEEVLVDSEIQKAVLVKEEAIRLIDQGKKDEAQNLISGNAEQMRTMAISNPKARAKLDVSVEESKQLSDTVATSSISSSRKALAEDAYSTKNQQQK